MKFGITERGDAALDQSWRYWEGPKILITKAPQSLGKIPANAIVHCTITGYGGSVLEPGVAKPEITLAAYDELVAKYGGERIVLRIDPIIPTVKGMEQAEAIIRHAQGRVRISFLDLYPHVKERFIKAGLPLPQSSFHADLGIRRFIAYGALQYRHEDIEICGEPEMECTGCVSERDVKALGLDCKLSGKCGQRQACKCAAEKHELLTRRGQCKHGCLYCYWR
jgi:DNA repair photolyase